jgi:cell shape-determining protein MreC
VISLRAKLKQKDTVEAENERLKKELNEFKQRQVDLQKKNVQLAEETR